MTSKYIGSFLSIAYNLGITFNRHSGSLRCAIDYGHNSLVAKCTCHNIYALDWDKLGLLALCYNVVALTPMQQTTGPTVHILLCLCALGLVESVASITREATREIATYITISYLLCAVHHYLSTIVELWYAVYGKEQSECLLESERVLTLTKEAIGVVVFYKRHYVRWIYIQIVVA